MNARGATGLNLVDDSLFVLDEHEALHLRGAVCGVCQTTSFPAQQSCPKCGAVEMEPVALPREGTLWAFTVQGFEPKSPYRGLDAFEPYGVGYIDVGSVRVESRLTVNAPENLCNDMLMQMCLIPVYRDDSGAMVHTYAFAPADLSQEVRDHA